MDWPGGQISGPTQVKIPCIHDIVAMLTQDSMGSNMAVAEAESRRLPGNAVLAALIQVIRAGVSCVIRMHEMNVKS